MVKGMTGAVLVLTTEASFLITGAGAGHEAGVTGAKATASATDCSETLATLGIAGLTGVAAGRGGVVLAAEVADFDLPLPVVEFEADAESVLEVELVVTTAWVAGD